MARPKKEINFDELEKLCGIQCSEEEVASWFNCSVDTIARRIKEETGGSFADYSKMYKGIGRISLKRKMFQEAMKGNIKMLIHLAKHYLGQYDKSIQGFDTELVIRHVYGNNSQAQSKDISVPAKQSKQD